MKKLIAKSTLFIVLVFIIDFLSGSIFTFLRLHAIGGDTKRNEYIVNKLNDDILIFGSSRAIHHYDPRIIEDSLDMTCYNCGNDGMGIILFYARYKQITERYIPKLILYDVTSGFDIQSGDNSKYLSWSRPYYDQSGVDSIFWKIDNLERIKMISNMYRYNSKILQMVADNLTPLRIDFKGYRPHTGIMEHEPRIEQKVSSKVTYDKIKIYYLEKLIKECKNKTKLVFLISPFYKGDSTAIKDYIPLIELCDKYKIPLLDYYSDSEISITKKYFQDSYHLNHTGVLKYNKKIISDLKKILKQPL